MKRLKIFGVPSWYTLKDQPNSGIFFKEQFEYLHSTYCDVVVLYVNLMSIKRFGGLPRITKSSDNGVTNYILSVYCPPGAFFKYLIWNISIVVLYFRARLDHCRPDLFHAHSTLWAGAGVRFISYLTGIPYIITEHATIYSQKRLSKLETLIVKSSLKHTHTLISVSSSLQNTMSHYFNHRRSIVIPNMVSITQFNASQSIQEECFTIFSAGILNKRKNFDLLIKAFHLSKHKVPNLILRIAGEGPERKSLEELIDKLDLGHSVKLLGELDRSSIAKEMSNSHVFISSSSAETFGVVLIEAMASGRPVIATRSGGPEDIINEATGILVKDGDPKSICDAIIQIFSEYHRYPSDIIREYAYTNFSQASVSKKIIMAYKAVLDEK